jgi:Predicted pPIWI-associating nuclease
LYDELVNSILGRLEKDFHKEIVQSSMNILKMPNISTKFSNFATNIRELTREVLYTLAPDDEVKKCKWYKKETAEGEADITRVQRMIYAIKGGLSDEFIKEELELDFENVTTKLNQVIRNLNKYTHINEKVYYRSEKTGFEMVEKTLVAFDNFLKTIEDIRTEIINRLEDRLYWRISEALTEDVIQEIDVLATHYWVDASTVNRITIAQITSSNIHIDVEGSVEVEHQYGSDGDFRRGNGVRVTSSYPFSLSLVLDINYPLEISLEPYDILVDNSHFYE